MNDTNNNIYSPLSLLINRQGETGFARLLPRHDKSHVETRLKDNKKADIISASFVKKLMLVTSILLIFTIIMLLGIYLLGSSISRSDHHTSTEKLEIIVANDYLQVPANKIRFDFQRQSGAQRKLDLYFHWPSLSGYTDELSHAFNNSNDSSHLVFLTVEPRTMSLDMTGRIAPIYTKFFEGRSKQTQYGLIQQSLGKEGGFIDEDLYYATASPHPFATRCVRKSLMSTTPFCIRDIHVGKGLILTYRFHKKHLPQWISLEKAVQALAKSMIINPDKTIRN